MAESVSVRDVARLAKVSASTVSNVLNGRLDRMRPETTKRVLNAIAKLGYTPNQLARQLKTGYVPIIGLIVPSVANPFWGVVARSVEEAAQAYGYQTLLCNAERDPGREQRYAETLWSSGIRGVIFGSSPLSFDHIAPLAKRGLQIVAFDRQMQSADQVIVDSVGVDNVLGTRLAVKHLLDLGHRQIGFLSGPIRTISRLDRLAGYRAALQEAG
ncbi:MAG: LacI family DNA-binding transcriptional regulator, partial [Ktedonobacteraceae bacterium]|nr:LacI family DNA-binding transcriptional regulator [Ktedonobacteraceae bacterium]